MYLSPHSVHLNGLSPEIKRQQESPTAWTQESYRPPRSKCSRCCSVYWVGGGGVTPSQVRGGVPWSGLDGGGYPILGGGTPARSWWWGDTQSQGWGGTLARSWWWGVPHPVGGTPQTWDGVPPTIKTWLGSPHQDLAGVPPPLSRPGWGTPPPPLGWGTPPGMWYPPPQTWDGVPPPPSRPGRGTPHHHPDLDGVPPPAKC